MKIRLCPYFGLALVQYSHGVVDNLHTQLNDNDQINSKIGHSLLLFGWAFTRQLTYLLWALMLYNSPLNSLARDMAVGCYWKQISWSLCTPTPGPPLTWFLFLCSSINVTITQTLFPVGLWSLTVWLFDLYKWLRTYWSNQ